MRDTHDERPVPAPQSSGDGAPKFGRLLIVLVFALLLIVAITLGSEAYFS